MKKILLTTIITLIGIHTATAQVGIGTEAPKTSLQVVGEPASSTTADGIQAPSLSLAQLDAKIAAYSTDQDGAILYIDDVSTTSTVKETLSIDTVGFYYYDADNDTWKTLGNTSTLAAGLVSVTENGNTGYRRADADVDNYGNIGDKAVDLSFSENASETLGATGTYSTTMGYLTTASGFTSTAMGSSTTASGLYSTAMGSGTTASGLYSTATGSSTTASGLYSTATGSGTTASERYSTATGSGTTASESYSTAMGYNTTASESYSTAMGSGTTASGLYSTATGYNTIASESYSTAMGSGTTASGLYSTAIGSGTTASESYSTAMGSGTTASEGNSTAMGYDTNASGYTSTAMGSGTTASEGNSTAMGYDTNASGYTSTAMGSSTTASGTFATAMGVGTTASGNTSTAMGSNTEALGTYSTAIGNETTAYDYGSVVIGQYNNTGNVATSATSFSESAPAFVIGNGVDSGTLSDAFVVDFSGNVTANAFVGDGSGLTDVKDASFDLTGAADGDLLRYDATASKWVKVTPDYISNGDTNVGFGTETPDGSAQLELQSTTKGFLPPRMTEDDRNKMSSPAQGLMIYCTNCGANGEAQLYNGMEWTNMTGGNASAGLYAPDAPAITGVTPGDGQAEIAYTAPTDSGSSAITKYTAASSPGNITGSISQAGSGTITVTGLTNGQAYTFTVTATNAVGTSVASGVSTSVKPSAPISTIIGPSGKIWMDRNLGASQVAGSITDHSAYGDLYQWGRGADGHQTIVWTSSTGSDGEEQNNEINTTSNSTAPGTAYIIGSANWYTGSNPDNLWQGVDGVNNPCPSGYRVPTEAEWQAELGTGKITNAQSAFDILKLPMAGYRSIGSGSLSHVGTYGNYWSSTFSGSYSRSLFFNSVTASMSTGSRAAGFAVRCLKD